jgi:hypothetical protein
MSLGMRSSQVNIPWVAWKSSVETMMSSTEAIQRVAVPTLQVEILMGGGGGSAFPPGGDPHGGGDDPLP